MLKLVGENKGLKALKLKINAESQNNRFKFLKHEEDIFITRN